MTKTVDSHMNSLKELELDSKIFYIFSVKKIVDEKSVFSRNCYKNNPVKEQSVYLLAKKKILS